MELTEFLLARIAEDGEEIGAWTHRDEGAGPNGLGWAEVGAISEVLMISHGRMLRECEAKRRVVDVHSPDHLEPDICATCSSHAEGYPCRTLLFLALPYADHPDFDEDWRR